MSIEFGFLGAAPGGSGAGRLLLRGQGHGGSGSYGGGRLVFRGGGSAAPALPEEPVVALGIGNLLFTGGGRLTVRGRGAGRLAFRAQGYGVASHGAGRLAFHALGSGEPPPIGLALLMMPGYLNVMVDVGIRVVLEDGVQLSATANAQAIWRLFEAARMGSAAGSTLSAINQLADAATLMDAMAVVWRMLVSADVLLADTPAHRLLAANRVIERLALTAGPTGTVTATQAVLSTLAMHDELHRMFGEELSDSVTMDDALHRGEHAQVIDSATLAANVSASLTQLSQALAAAVMADVPTGAVVVHVVVEEGAALGDSLASILEALTRVDDAVLLAATFHIDNGVYSAWVCHTQNRAFTRYENYPFNSFAQLGGEYLGCAPDGIYVLEGDDDAGEPISARIRTAMDNMGTGRMKRVPSMYLGYRSDGTVVLKAITTSETGEKEETWYQLVEQPAHEVREGRIKLGRGLKSVYWQFELMNVDGADFELADLKLFPMVLDRRL